MYIPEHQTRIVHQALLRETLEHQSMRSSRAPKQTPAKKRRLLRAPARLMVRLGRTLEGFGQAYLEDKAAC